MSEAGPAPDADLEDYEQEISQDDSAHEERQEIGDDGHGDDGDDSDADDGHQFGSPEADHRAERRGLSTDALAGNSRRQ